MITCWCVVKHEYNIWFESIKKSVDYDIVVNEIFSDLQMVLKVLWGIERIVHYAIRTWNNPKSTRSPVTTKYPKCERAGMTAVSNEQSIMPTNNKFFEPNFSAKLPATIWSNR